MEPRDVLLNLGFNKKEAQVYLAALELGEATITDIAQKANLPRTTSYGIITSLSQKGLISFNVKKRRKYFFGENPARLLNIVRERERLLRESMPSLQLIHNSSSAKPKIRFYEGEGGIKSILEDILKTKKSLLAITAVQDMMKIFKDYFPYFIESRARRKIKVKLLTKKTSESIDLAKRDKEELRQTKFVSTKFSFHTANFIYGNKVAIISIKKQPIIGIVIEDSDIVNTQKMLFEIIWGK